MKSFLVIGLGRFGRAVACGRGARGHEGIARANTAANLQPHPATRPPALLLSFFHVLAKRQQDHSGLFARGEPLRAEIFDAVVV